MKSFRLVSVFLALGAAFAAHAADALAQGAPSLIEAARTKLEDVQPDSASVLLVRALGNSGNLSTSEQLRGWTLLGIAELMRGHENVARQAFRRALERDANLRIDSLAYLHSDLRQVFAVEKDAYRVENRDDGPLTMNVRMALDTVVQAGRGRYTFEVRPARRARVIASIVPAGNEQAEPLWADTTSANPVGVFSWSLRAGSSTIMPGRYALHVVASDGSNHPPVYVSRTFTVSRVPVDTITASALPEDSLLPEGTLVRRPSSLVAGLALGAGAVMMTSLVANKDLNSGHSEPGRYVVAGAVSLAGLVGFLKGRQERSLPENISYNQNLRDRYDRLASDAAAENRRRVANAPLRVRMDPVRMEGTR